MVRSATLNMQLGALRDQQQLRENCFLKMFVSSKLWKVADPLKQHKEPKVNARRAHLGRERGCHGAGRCQPPRARFLEPCVAVLEMRRSLWNRGRAYTPPNAPGDAWSTSPSVNARWPPGALVPAAPCTYATAQSAWPLAGTSTLEGALGDDGPKTAQAATSETRAPSPGVWFRWTPGAFVSAARCTDSLSAAPIPPSPQKLDFQFLNLLRCSWVMRL